MFKIKIMIKIKGRYTKQFRKKVAFLTFYETINFSVSLCLRDFVAELWMINNFINCLTDSAFHGQDIKKLEKELKNVSRDICNS